MKQKTNMIPNDIKVEQVVLGAIMMNPDNAHVAVEHLRVKDFYVTKNKTIFSAMKALFKEGVSLNLVTVSCYLEGKHKLKDINGASYLTTLLNTLPVTYNMIDFCNILKKVTYKREVYFLTEKYKAGDIEFDEMTDKILDFPSLEKETDEATLKELFLATLQKTTEGVAHKFDIKELNNCMGGVDKGETVTIGGYTSQGKTMFGLQLAKGFAEQGKRVLFCTSEMTPLETARRLLSNTTDTNIMKFRKGQLNPMDMAKIEQAGKSMGEVWDIIIRSVFYTSDIRHLVMKYNPDIVFVDYLQNLDRHGVYNDYQRVTSNMKDLQSMTLENQISTFVLSQLKRRQENGIIPRPRLSDLRDSGAIEEKSNMVMFVYWKNRLKEESEIRRGGEPPEDMQIIISKNRDGAIGQVLLDFYPEYCKICSKGYESYYDDYPNKNNDKISTDVSQVEQVTMPV